MTELPQLPFESAEAWEDWLQEHHADAPGIWVQFAKKASGLPTVSYQQRECPEGTFATLARGQDYSDAGRVRSIRTAGDLVVVRPGGDAGRRYDMLEPVAQYARSLLLGEDVSTRLRRDIQRLFEKVSSLR